MRSDDWSLGTLIDWVAALALTFAIARYGLGALFSMLPWLAVRDRARPWPWGAFAFAALMLGLAIAIRSGGARPVESCALGSSNSGLRLGAHLWACSCGHGAG